MEPNTQKRRAPRVAGRARARGALLAACLLGSAALAGAATAQAQSPNASPTIQTESGAVVGRSAGNTAQFLGIPYAAPPTGALRFRPPQPRAPWSAPLQATEFGSPCPQPPRLGSPSANEDCLFLNVFAPTRGPGRRPVMVFIHGGSFTAGNGGVALNGPDYTGTEIVEQAGVVVVTINYRLSVLGFLAAPALDAEDPRGVSGNYGLQDQQLALRWVKRNIENFGGDPGNVTVFGESAGGISVLYHLVSPDAGGLFQRAIVESSNDALSVPLAQAEAIYAPIVAALGCGGAADTAACLRAVPVEAIVNSGLAAGPILDGATVPRQPRDAFAAGQFNRVPVIMGTNSDEGTYFLSAAAIAAGRAPTPADYANAIQANFGAAAAQAIEAAYPLEEYPSPGQALAAILTDSFFACPTELVRTSLARTVPTYGYEFAKQAFVPNFPVPKGPGLTLGATHTAELAYVFGHDAKGAPLPQGPDRDLSDAIIRYWTNFAASGNPNRATAGGDARADRQPQQQAQSSGADDGQGAPAGEGRRGPRWPAYTKPSGRVLSLSAQIRPEGGFAEAHRCALRASLGYPQRLITALPPAAP
ncbi:MAG: carboxylesterase family protein [Acetobacteraceae bacterium]|nr:carboxylesterase family protein [Acetobacteraceae bacterium]